MRTALRTPLVIAALILPASCGDDSDVAATSPVDPTTTTTTVLAERVELVVGGELSECEDVDLRTCLVVLRPDDTSWSNFYSGIEGFEFAEGVRSTLLVERTRVMDPDADDTGERYRLLEVIASEPESDPPSPGDEP